MSKRKGLSAEDKRAVILKIYHETKDVYNLKEIEHLASKAGVVLQTVKEHNQGLIDDGLVNSDKIGSSNFFWSFPSKAYQDRIFERDRLKLKMETSKRTIDELKTKIEVNEEQRKAPGRQEKVVYNISSLYYISSKDLLIYLPIRFRD